MYRFKKDTKILFQLQFEIDNNLIFIILCMFFIIDIFILKTAGSKWLLSKYLKYLYTFKHTFNNIIFYSILNFYVIFCHIL